MSESDLRRKLRAAARQEQFLEVVGRDEAAARFHRHLTLAPVGSETVPLSAALNRVLARDVAAGVDVPGFDRSGVDGFAVRSADTVGASEERPRVLTLNAEVLTPGQAPALTVEPGTATLIATGGMVPRGADAVVMVEHTDVIDGAEIEGVGDAVRVEFHRAAAPGQFIAYAASDIARGETVLRAGRLLTSREIGVLAAIGRAEVEVCRRPRVAVLSTGDEIVAPGEPIPAGKVYDSNGAIVAAAVAELGGEPVPMGIRPDDEAALRDAVEQGLSGCDMMILSGGTSKGAGDLCYRVISRFTDPGIVVHGVALKPGKPLCLAVTGGKPLVVLPGFPTSAIFTFHEFVAPVIRALAGLPPERGETIPATLPIRLTSERGRTEFSMVSLVRTDAGLAAYPLAKGSGAVTAFSHADGFVAIPQHEEAVEAGTDVTVQLIGRGVEPADLVVIGSHCVGLDHLLGLLQRRGVTVKVLNVGSMGGLTAARRGECDLAPVHLMDPATGGYNEPFLTEGLTLVQGYRRLQGVLFRPGDLRFEGRDAAGAMADAAVDPGCLMINRNPGSGTRILADRVLAGARPAGYQAQAKSHNAVAAAVAQGRADWGLAIETVAADYRLGFLPLQPEHYDFVVPAGRLDRPAVQAFVALLADPETRRWLEAKGFSPAPSPR
ncbi:molybdopterin biosynthesis protein [Skermanella rosea]|uniref:molybdopterin biosynthesis protein n=1 Tax=Skermanella rosea TaxID=1817965 RepID=UPI00193306FA|nr:molybdopterin biosynthesis protein [Skermanella rosea]UEM03294.1 molybdopterin biosynthesis protein [Skermanella rosea]